MLVNNQCCSMKVLTALTKLQATFHDNMQLNFIFRCFQVLYLDVLKLVPTELDKVMELLEEKELRLCIPVEEVKLML